MQEQTEDRLQQSCFMWFHNTYPALRGLLCYNLNNSANAIAGARDKSMGLQAGRSDMVLYYQCHAYMIEFKTDAGKQSKGQIEWQAAIERQGFTYVIIRTLDEFKVCISNMIK